MIETKRLLIKPLTAEELKRHIDSPDDFARELGMIPSQSVKVLEKNDFRVIQQKDNSVILKLDIDGIGQVKSLKAKYI